MKNCITIILAIFILVACQNPKTEETQNIEVVIRDTIVVRDTFVKTKIEKKAVADISLSKLNIFYVGLDNPIEIKTMGIEGDVSVNISDGSIRKLGTGKYSVKVKKEGTTTINVYADGKKIGSKKFTCKLVPDPTVSFNGLKQGHITKNELLDTNNQIETTLHSFYDIEFPITEFTIISSSGGFIEKITTTGSKITQEQRELIKPLKRGNKVYFSNIKAQAPDGSIRELGSIVFTITE